MFFSRSKSKLGVDIGTSSIKVAQIKQENEKYILETYGVVNVSLPQKSSTRFDAIAETAQILKQLVAKSGATTNKIVASLPNSIVFVSTIEMPAMSDKEMKQAIEWEARRYVPLPLEEVTLSWSVMREPGASQVKVLLTAVPSAVIENYLKMFKIVGLEPKALGIEALALIRSLIGPKKESFIIVDIGARTSSLNLVDKGFLRVSRNLSVGGETITQAIAQSLKISPARAEAFKRNMGLSKNIGQIPKAMRPALDTMKSEIEQLINIYESSGGAIAEVVLTGNGSNLPGLPDFFSTIGPKITLGDPLKFLSYDQGVKPSLTNIAPALSVAIGLGMRD
ncbi:type IV pilus assembly protein PilM [bacterium]|nr:MAG: type IV pilus assembly protein PilM [bacterium]